MERTPDATDKASRDFRKSGFLKDATNKASITSLERILIKVKREAVHNRMDHGPAVSWRRSPNPTDGASRPSLPRSKSNFNHLDAV